MPKSRLPSYRLHKASGQAVVRINGRLIYIGPKGQEVLLPYLLRPADAYCFVPRESEARRHALQREARQTPLTPSSEVRKPKANPKRQPGRRYTSDSYRRAIQRACERHGLPMWAPNQLRKAAATAIRAVLDVESAASVLGHSSSVVTQDFYSKVSAERAIEAVRRLG